MLTFGPGDLIRPTQDHQTNASSVKVDFASAASRLFHTTATPPSIVPNFLLAPSVGSVEGLNSESDSDTGSNGERQHEG